MLKIDLTVDLRKHNGAFGVLVFAAFLQNFTGAVQTGKRLSNLRSNACDLGHRRDQKAHEHGVTEQPAHRHMSGKNLARAHIHNDRADHAQNHR